MLNKLGLITICTFLLTSCSYFNIGQNKSRDQYSRCKEIKRQLIYSNSNSNQMGGEFSNNLTANNQMIGPRNTAIQDNLNREYRDNDCR